MISQPRTSIRIAGAMPLVLLSAATHAGGLYVGEFGQPNQGASRAGANALAEDASTALQNPAGVMFLDEKKTMVTGLLIKSKLEFEQSETFPNTPTAVANSGGNGPASNGGDGGSTSVGGALFHASPVNEKWGWGVAFGSISAAVIDQENKADFAGRYWASEVDLLTIGLTGSISYKFTENFSASVHNSLSYGELELEVYAPGPLPNSPDLGSGPINIEDGDDTVWSYGASAMWQATDSLRLGIVYNSEIEFDFDSDLNLSNLPPNTSVGAGVEITYPQTIRASATQDLTEELTLLASIAWEDWSSFDDIPINTAAGGNALPRNWDDTYFFALGLRWQPEARWTYYTGIGYDTDPTNKNNRTADMPIDEQWRLSGGVTYERDNGHKIGGVLTLADYGSARIDNGGNRPGPGSAPWTVKGKYDTNRLIFAGINYGW